jgi:phosphoenolpyruvate carboxykinase (GTP)
MTSIHDILASSNLSKPVQEFVRHWAAHTGAVGVEIVSAADDDRLLAEALAAGEIVPVQGGNYYSRSYPKDTARSEERTFVSTSNPADAGVYNNWRPASEMKPLMESLTRGASAGKTMYVVPYLMSPPGSPLDQWSAGVELTDSRVVVLHMIRMARVGADLLQDLPDPSNFVRGVHVTGDLESLGHGTENDQRHFVTFADERLIMHYGSSYGGNALLGKIAHGLRQASYDGQACGTFLAEQFMLIGIVDRQENRTYYIAGGFPSASGKTNLAMMKPPAALAGRYEVHFFGDDITWMYVGEDGRLYGFNPEAGVFGVAKDTNEKSNPNAMAAVGAGTRTLFTNVAYNEKTQQVWWEGLTPDYPADLDGWLDWKGGLISERPAEKQRPTAPGDEWSHPNSRFTTSLANVPNVSPDAGKPEGVPIDAIIFGGRVKEREPLIRAVRDLAEGVYDGLTLGAEATAAADGKAGVLRYDPMSMRPFLSYAEGRYAQHWLDLIGRVKEPPIFAHVNWFQRDAGGRYLWPGYGENLRALLWLLDLHEGRVAGRETPIGILPLPSELNLEGLNLDSAILHRLLDYDTTLWQREVDERSKHLAGFTGLPKPISDAHRRLSDSLHDAMGRK